MNIKYSILVLKEYKKDFDNIVLQTLINYKVPKEIAKSVYNLAVAAFPEFNIKKVNINRNLNSKFSDYSPQELGDDIYAYSTKKREKLISVLKTSNLSISKILNTQRFSLRDLKMKMPEKLNLIEFFADPVN